MSNKGHSGGGTRRWYRDLWKMVQEDGRDNGGIAGKALALSGDLVEQRARAISKQRESYRKSLEHSSRAKANARLEVEGSAMRDRIAALEADLQEMRERQKNIVDHVDTVEEKVDDVTETIGAVDTRVNSLEENMVDVQDDVQGLTDIVDEHDEYFFYLKMYFQMSAASVEEARDILDAASLRRVYEWARQTIVEAFQIAAEVFRFRKDNNEDLFFSDCVDEYKYIQPDETIQIIHFPSWHKFRQALDSFQKWLPSHTWDFPMFYQSWPFHSPFPKDHAEMEDALTALLPILYSAFEVHQNEVASLASALSALGYTVTTTSAAEALITSLVPVCDSPQAGGQPTKEQMVALRLLQDYVNMRNDEITLASAIFMITDRDIFHYILDNTSDFIKFILHSMHGQTINPKYLPRAAERLHAEGFSSKYRDRYKEVEKTLEVLDPDKTESRLAQGGSEGFSSRLDDELARSAVTGALRWLESRQQSTGQQSTETLVSSTRGSHPPSSYPKSPVSVRASNTAGIMQRPMGKGSLKRPSEDIDRASSKSRKVDYKPQKGYRDDVRSPPPRRRGYQNAHRQGWKDRRGDCRDNRDSGRTSRCYDHHYLDDEYYSDSNEGRDADVKGKGKGRAK
ncbi:hypothetical protein ACEPAI_9841 [Sanghuangporus weigelae]